MSMSLNHRLITEHLYSHGRSTVAQITAASSLDRQEVVNALTSLERHLAVEYDPQTDTFILTERAAMRWMRRKSKTKETHMTDTPSAIDLQKERDRLVLDMEGPHALAVEACEVDPVLHERLGIAIGQGMPPVDLVAVPNYRRPAAVEEALDNWARMTAHGPCSLCGSRTIRPPYASLGYLDDPLSYGFSLRSDGSPACAWCAGYLATHTVDELREAVFNAVAGTRGIAVDEYRRSHPTLTPLAAEVGYAGVAWGHIMGEHQDAQVRRRAIQMRAAEVVHHTRYVTNEAEAKRISLPGIAAPVWDVEDVPKPARKFMRKTKGDVRAEQRHIEEVAALRKQREREAAQRAQMHANLRKRDERLAAMDPEDRQAELERIERTNKARAY